jgi:hypothetical protein
MTQSDDLRREVEKVVEQFRNERFRSGDATKGILNTGRLTDLLVAFAKAQRAVEVQAIRKHLINFPNRPLTNQIILWLGQREREIGK